VPHGSHRGFLAIWEIAPIEVKRGHSGNPGGRPKVGAEVKSLAMTYTQDAVETLTAIMRTDKAPLIARAAAANSLLDRAIGKPELSARVESTRPQDLAPSLLTPQEQEEEAELEATLRPYLDKMRKAG
jgi:hypothetical protein